MVQFSFLIWFNSFKNTILEVTIRKYEILSCYLHPVHAGDRVAVSQSIPFPIWIRCDYWISISRTSISDVTKSDRDAVLKSRYRDENHGALFSYVFIKPIKFSK